MKKIVIISSILLCSLNLFSQINLLVLNEKSEPISFCKMTYSINGETRILWSNVDGKTTIPKIDCKKNVCLHYLDTLDCNPLS